MEPERESFIYEIVESNDCVLLCYCSWHTFCYVWCTDLFDVKCVGETSGELARIDGELQKCVLSPAPVEMNVCFAHGTQALSK